MADVTVSDGGGLYRDDEFIGHFEMIVGGDELHIQWMGLDEAERGNGYGSAALRA
jgi:hypothetical protein